MGFRVLSRFPNTFAYYSGLAAEPQKKKLHRVLLGNLAIGTMMAELFLCLQQGSFRGSIMGSWLNLWGIFARGPKGASLRTSVLNE